MQLKHLLKTIGLMVMAVLLLNANTTFAQNGKWAVESDKNGIRVESMLETGHTYKTYKGSMTVKANDGDVIEVMRNINGYVDWMYNTIDAKLIHPKASGGVVDANVFTENDTYDFYIYTVNEASPLQDRDLVSKATMRKKGENRVELVMQSVPDYIGEDHNYTRVHEFSGQWVFENIDDNQIKITYQIYTDPRISAWIPGVTGQVNTNSFDTVYKTLTKMREKF